MPTLFKHKLSRVKFAVRKKSDYPGATITLNSITFKNLVYGMIYSQFWKDASKGIIHDYIVTKGAARSEQEYTKTDFEVSSTAFVPVPDTNEVRYIYIPQDFKGVTETDNIATIEVKYTVTLKKVSPRPTPKLSMSRIFSTAGKSARDILSTSFSLSMRSTGLLA